MENFSSNSNNNSIITAATSFSGSFSSDSLREEEDGFNGFAAAEDALYGDSGSTLYGISEQTPSYTSRSFDAISGSENNSSDFSSLASVSQSAEQTASMEVITNSGCGCSACCGGNTLSNIESGLSSDANESLGFITESGGGGGGQDSGKPMADPQEFADYLTTGFWQAVGSDSHQWAQHNVTYSLSNEFTAAQQDGIRMGFDLWADVADITFTEVANGADITIVEGDDGRAYSSSSVFGNGNIASNTISIDTNVGGWSDLSTIGSYGLQTVIHEIGHTLGLGHSGNYNGSANYNNDAIWANDTRQYSVMSYFQAHHSGADHLSNTGTKYGSTPLLYDVLAIQDIYGANNTTRSGNTTYGFNSTAGHDQFDFTSRFDPVVTIWDAGGVDTIDLSGFTSVQNLNLNEGTFSSVGVFMADNLSIAHGTIIENAIGTIRDDTFYGNQVDNIILAGAGDDMLYGSVGDDTLNGQDGSDTVEYTYAVNSFAYNFIDGITVALTHAVESFTDTLISIENFIFNGASYTFAELFNLYGNSAPTVTVLNLDVEMGDSVLASTAITGSDPDGDAITYEVWDDGTAGNSGYFELDGNALAANTGHVLTQAEFDRLEIVGGSAIGSEALWVRVSDAEHTSNWVSFDLNTTGAGTGNYAPPTVNANNTDIDIGNAILASTAISASDPDGNEITYEVWDSGTGANSGFFDLDGNALAAGASHILTAAEFSRLEVSAGSQEGTETMWVRVSDGEYSSSWTSFSVTSNAVGPVNNFAPTVTTNNLSVASGDTALASTAIAASDADGNPMTYQVWDSGTAGDTGYFELDGNALAANTGHILTQAEFDRLEIVGGSTTGDETLWVLVSDGTYDTAWESFTLTTTAAGGGGGGANEAPTVTANNLSVESGSFALASSAITATDNDGDALTYELWDSGQASTSGFFELAGQELAANQSHFLTEAEFANARIVGGDNAASETLWVRVSDGQENSAWQSFGLTTTAASGGGGGGGGGGGAAPTVTANDISLGTGSNILASTLISANDPEGDDISYEVWDGGLTNNSGYFDLDGNVLASGQGHVLTQEEFDRLELYAGSHEASETMWVRASDGNSTTDWEAFTVSTTTSANNVAMEDVLEFNSAEQDALDGLGSGDQTLGNGGSYNDQAYVFDQNSPDDLLNNSQNNHVI